jgi:hypothetical protein
VTLRENVAFASRVEEAERAVVDQELLCVRTTLVICDRGDEPDYLTPAEVLEAAKRIALHPPIRVVERRPDLCLLIDPVAGTRKLRHAQRTPEKLAAFDALVAEARVIDVEIRCHPKQVDAILSDAPVSATFGGNRAGKTRGGGGWWLFRRWMLRGGAINGDPAVFWWVNPEITKAIEFGAWLIAGPNCMGGGMWPDEVFAAFKPITKKSKDPSLTLIDGSRIDFHHAHHSGEQAGSNLKSANVRDIVVDEAGAIRNKQNWQQLLVRVSQSGGSVSAATTRVRNHWSTSEIEGNTSSAVVTREIDLFDNPWMSYAAIYQLFLADQTFTDRQLAEILEFPREEQAAACRAKITRPESLLEHLGVAVEAADRLWTEWTGEHVVTDRETQHPTLIVTGEDGRALKLINCTALMLAAKWPAMRDRMREEGRPMPGTWAGMDFNFCGHATTFELFGEGRNATEAYANQASWRVLVNSEVEVQGPTLKLAEALRKSTGGSIPIWCDPTGAMSGHDARGTGGSTDVAELLKAGFTAAPCNGYKPAPSGQPRQPQHLSLVDSRNVCHRLMHEGRLYVHARCTGLLDALEHDKPTKTSGVNSVSDRRSGWSDAMRYGLVKVFWHLLKRDAAKAA